MKFTKAEREQARKEWIAALRSGKYEQTHSSLHHEGGYCCLGVACDLFADKLGISRTFSRPDDCAIFEIFDEIFDGHDASLPSKVVHLLGLRDGFGASAADTARNLADLNDKGASFLEIADALETGDYWTDEETDD